MKLLFLPNEILNIIFNNLSLIDKKGLLLLNKGNIFKQKVINEYRNVIKIQRFYKNNLPRLPQVQHYNSTYDSLYNKKIMVTGHRDHKATQCCGDPMYEWITSDSPRWKKPKRKVSKWSRKKAAKKYKII